MYQLDNDLPEMQLEPVAGDARIFLSALSRLERRSASDKRLDLSLSASENALSIVFRSKNEN